MKMRFAKGSMVIGLTFTAFLGMTAMGMASSDSAGHGGGAGGPGAAEVKTPATVLKAAIQGNDDFKTKHDSHYFDAFQTSQVPGMTVVTCSDSRVHTPLFGMDPNNNLFMIRDIGNQIKTAEGSVDYGVRHLPTKVLLVLGHSGCGAIKAAMGDYSQESQGIKHELVTLEEPLKADPGEGEFNVRWAQNVERNVDYQVAYAKKLYQEKVEAGKLAIIGAVYDFTDAYGRGRGALVITNVNGETNPAELMNNPLLKELSPAQIVNHVGSLAPDTSF